MRAQGMVQSEAPDAIWVQSIEVVRKRVPHPSNADEKKKALVEKVVVIVKGRISKDVNQTLNQFVERLRKQPDAPYISIEKTAQRGNGVFEVMIDFAGWPDSKTDEEGDDS
jgi:predicted metal-binding protein